MNYRNLGKHGIKVSELSLGSWITAGGKYPKADSIAVHRKAFELGINTFDTADVYSAGEAELIVGEALRDLPRKDLVLATKCGFGMGSGPNDKGLHVKHVTEACDASLKRLGVEYIDIYQAHMFDPTTPIEETCRAFDALVRRGKVLYWGISNWSGSQIQEAVSICDASGFARPASLQPRYNMFARDIEKGQVPVCGKFGLGIIVYSPLSQGVLTGKYLAGAPAGSRGASDKNFTQRFLTDYNHSGVTDLTAIAKAAELSLAQMALAWVLRLPEMSSAIVGASRPEQLEETVKASGVKLSDSVLQQIQRALDLRWAMVLEEDSRKLRETPQPGK